MAAPPFDTDRLFGGNFGSTTDGGLGSQVLKEDIDVLISSKSSTDRDLTITYSNGQTGVVPILAKSGPAFVVPGSMKIRSIALSATDAGVTWNIGPRGAFNFLKLGGGGASGAVTQVSNVDGSLTIAPTIGAVVASLNVSNPNTWLALQSFGNTNLNFGGASILIATLTTGNCLQYNGSNWVNQTYGLAVVAKSSGSPYTVGANDELILVTTGAGAFTVNLPAASARAGRRIVVVKVDSGAGAVTVARAGADLIESATSVSLPTQWKKCHLVSDGVSTWVDLASTLV